MFRIVLLSTYYQNKPSANGICAKNLVGELKKRGYEVNVICYNNNSINEKNVYYVREPLIENNNKFKKVLRKLFMFLRQVILIKSPIINKKLSNDYYNQLKKINNNKKIDVIISMCFPIESVDAAYRFKKNHPFVKFLIYELDSFGDGVFTSLLQKFNARKADNWLKKVYKLANKVFVMKGHEIYWKKRFGKEYINKLCVTDLPILVARTSHSNVSFKNTYYFLYAGLIQSSYRNPEYLLKLFENLTKFCDFEFSFYSKGDCEKLIAREIIKFPQIKQYGYVSENILNEAILETDVLISIGNRVSSSVPSKLINYFSYGKPIIHFSSRKDDICIMYLKKYPLALIIDECESIEENTIKLYKFLLKLHGKSINLSEILIDYYMNTPSYNVNLIEKMMQ